MRKSLLDTKQAQAKIAACGLTRNELEVLALNLFDGFNAVEIASRLNLNTRVAQRHLRLAIRKIKNAGINLPPPRNQKIKYLQLDENEWEEIPAPQKLPRDLKPINSLI